MKKPDAKELINLLKGDLTKFYAYLISGSVHGKPGLPVGELGRIEKVIKENLSQEDQYKLAKDLLKRPEYTARNIGLHLITAGWPKHKDVEKLVLKAADDSDWIVREYAAGTFARLLEMDFTHYSGVFKKWVKSQTPNVKRAIALAIKYEAKKHDSKKWKFYLFLITELLKEENEYVRKNLGQFAIGDGLLKKFPQEILSSAKEWVLSDNKNVRWNTAMIFTASAAKQFSKEGKALLKHLENDVEPMVKRAAKSALKKLGK